jgi:hypothetical protein
VRLFGSIDGSLTTRDVPHWLGDYWDADVRSIQFPAGKSIAGVSVAGTAISGISVASKSVADAGVTGSVAAVTGV